MTASPADLQPLVLFDGPCHLCQRSVRFILRHEKEPKLRFTSLQTDLAEQVRTRYKVPPDTDAMILLEDGQAFIGSDAALRLAGYLKAPYRWFRVFRFLPRRLHGSLYRWIARNRTKWFGRDDSCPLPDPEQQERFITD